MSVIDSRTAGDPEQTRWGALIDRLVDGLTNLAADRLRLAGLEVRDEAVKYATAAAAMLGAALAALLGIVYLCNGVVALLEPPHLLGPAGARLTVALVLLLIAAGAVAAAVWSVKSRSSASAAAEALDRLPTTPGTPTAPTAPTTPNTPASPGRMGTPAAT